MNSALGTPRPSHLTPEPSLRAPSPTQPQEPTAEALTVEELQARLRVFAETSVQGKIVLRHYRPLFANAMAARLLGFSDLAELTRRLSVLDLLDLDTRTDPAEAERIAMLGPKSATATWRRKDGAPIRVNLMSRPMLWRNESALLVAFVDVTAQDAAERAAELALRRAAEAWRARNALLSTVSHHLRTPLHAAMGRLTLMLETDLAAQPRRLAMEALGDARRMLFQIDDILDAAAIESQSPHLRAEAFDVSTAVDDALQACGGSDDQDVRDLRIIAPLPGALFVIGDQRRFARIVLAMIEEARAQGGGLRRATVRVDHDGEATTIEITVQNPRAEAAIGARGILDGFRLASAMASAFGGALAAERITTAADAPQSSAGRTEIWRARARLPFAKTAGATEAHPSPPKEGALRILAADDHAGNRRLLALLLESLGHHATLVEDGAQALAAATDGRFDFIILDLMMPVMDGYEAARRIRELPAPLGQLPMIALTADASAAAHVEAEAAGMDAVLTKPVEVRRLAETIALLTAPAAAASV